MVGYAATFLILLVLVLAEQGWIRLRKGKRIDWLNMAANLNSGHLLMWLLRGVEVMAYVAVLEHASLGWVGRWPAALQWATGLIGWDFCFYLMHRAHHAVPALWRIHAVHHQGPEMSFSLAIRNSWYSSLSDFPFMLPLAVLGLPLEIFLSVSGFHYAIQFWNHVSPELVGKLGILDRILVTPSNHRSHHGLQAIYHNKNFGSTFLCWDKLFGSYQPELDDLPALYGLGGHPPVNNPLVMNHMRLHGRATHGSGQAVPSPYIGAGAVLLFCLVACAVARTGREGQVLLDAGIVLGSIALGASADRVRGALVAWCLLASAALGWAVCYAAEPFSLAVAGMLALHGVAGWMLVGEQDKKKAPE